MMAEMAALSLVDKPLHIPDWRCVDGLHRFPTTWTLDRQAEPQRLVRDAEFPFANRAFRLGADIVEFVCHVRDIICARAVVYRGGASKAAA